MITREEYGLLAAHVYANSKLVRSERNAAPLPQGWEPLPVPAGAPLVLPDGFMARAYTNGAEVVVVYAGTTAEDNQDWIHGNLPAVFGIHAPQVEDAMRFYLQVQEYLTTTDQTLVPRGAPVSFTGHSLGGGLASLMSVYFDRPATVFNAAPFERSADSIVVLEYLSNLIQQDSCCPRN